MYNIILIMKTLSCLIITLGIIASCNACKRAQHEIRVCNGTDYEITLNTSLFVDKTLLLNRFIRSTQHGLGILVRAPRYFGKSTNMDMIKRFCEINVDSKGQQVDIEKTKNYNLFKNNNLKIYQMKYFFDEHFGKYPVIFIDYEPLSLVTSVEEMLAVLFKIVMMNTFLQHEYLLNDTDFWTLNTTRRWVDRHKFSVFIDPNLSMKLTESDVQTGFSYLARLLHLKFGQRVTVLIDNFDCFIDSPLYKQFPNTFFFMSTVNSDILKCISVERSLVTGVTRSSGPSVNELPSCVVNSEEKHGLWPYYGLNNKELESLLQPIFPNDEHRERVMAKIVQEYGGYGVATFEAGEVENGEQMLDTQTCSVWSVVQYMEKELANDNYSPLE